MPILLQIPYRYSSGARCFPFFNDCLRLSTFFLLYLLHQKTLCALLHRVFFFRVHQVISPSILRISLISSALFNESSISIRSYLASLFKGSTMFFDCFSRGGQPGLQRILTLMHRFIILAIHIILLIAYPPIHFRRIVA